MATRQAWLAFEQAGAEDKPKYLRLALAAIRFKVALLETVGAIPRAPIPVALSLEERAVAGLTPEERAGLRAVPRELRREAGDVIDATVSGQPDVGPAFPECNDELVGVRDGRA